MAVGYDDDVAVAGDEFEGAEDGGQFGALVGLTGAGEGGGYVSMKGGWGVSGEWIGGKERKGGGGGVGVGG